MGGKNNADVNFVNATKLGAIFLVLYIPFMTVQNLLSEVQKESGNGSLGFWLLAVLYLFQMIGSIISAAILDKISQRTTFLLGGLNLSMFVLCQIVPAEKAELNTNPDKDQSAFMKFLTGQNVCITICFIGSILAGFGQAVLWVAQGEYMSSCATEDTKGFFFGYFWVWYMASQIIGNFIGSYIIEDSSGPTFFFIMGAIMLVGNVGFLFLQKPHQDIDKQIDSKFEGLQKAFENDQTEALVDQNGYQPQSSLSLVEEEQKETFSDIIKSTMKLTFSKKMMFFNAQLMWTGASISFWSGILTPIMVLQLKNDFPEMAETERDSRALIGMVAFGCGEVIGGYFTGKILDKIGSKQGVLLNMLLVGAVTIITVFSILSEHYGWLTFVMCFIWGIQDGAVNIHTFQILGFEFVSKSEPFSVFNLVQGIAVFGVEGIQGSIDSDDKHQQMLYTIVCGGFGMVACGITYFMPFNKTDNSELTRDLQISATTSGHISSSLPQSPTGSKYKLNTSDNNSSIHRLSNVAPDITPEQPASI